MDLPRISGLLQPTLNFNKNTTEAFAAAQQKKRDEIAANFTINGEPAKVKYINDPSELNSGNYEIKTTDGAAITLDQNKAQMLTNTPAWLDKLQSFIDKLGNEALIILVGVLLVLAIFDD